MEILEIINKLKSINNLSSIIKIERLIHEDDDDFYDAWKIVTNIKTYLLKEVSQKELDIYKNILIPLKSSFVPYIYETIDFNNNKFMLMEYIEGANLNHCERNSLKLTLDALISLQKKTWLKDDISSFGYTFNESLNTRLTRGKFLNNEKLEKVYSEFYSLYSVTPKALVHDDLLPFNVMVTNSKAVLIDWEYAGLLPYPSSIARLIAHGENDRNALFYMSDEDKKFAIDYYYNTLLKEKSISYENWLKTLKYFLFYEYCEWIYIANKNNSFDNIYYKISLTKALKLAKEIIE